MNEELKQAIIDRLEGWELVDFLQIPIDRIVDAFEEEIEENIEDVEDFVGLRELPEDDDEQD